MYAAIHIPNDPGKGLTLLAIGKAFSPEVEQSADASTIVFAIDPLIRLIGGPEEVASEIARRSNERGLHGQIGIAANPEVAILAARHTKTMHLIPAGEERRHLARLPIEALFEPADDLEAIEILDRWGIRTIEDFVKLPEAGIAERLGLRGLKLLKIARGESTRPLRPVREGVRYDERIETDHPIALLEPLLFLVSRLLNELCGRLRTHSRATTELRLKLELENKTSHTRMLQLPFPTHDAAVLAKLVQLDLEAHPPAAPIAALAIAVTPVDPRVIQKGLYTPPAPEPEKLELTLTKIRAMVGAGKAGSPELLNTFKPDSWRMRAAPPGPKRSLMFVEESACEVGVRLAFRYFRPPIEARVELADEGIPKRIFATGVWGAVVQVAGPWRASGEWWNHDQHWSRQEWDVALNDGAIYRMYLAGRRWFVEGVYD
jgi:protein ImuB